MAMGMAQKTGSASSIRIVRLGPDHPTMSSMPKAPDDTKMKIMATTANRRMLTVRSCSVICRFPPEDRRRQFSLSV